MTATKSTRIQCWVLVATLAIAGCASVPLAGSSPSSTSTHPSQGHEQGGHQDPHVLPGQGLARQPARSRAPRGAPSSADDGEVHRSRPRVTAAPADKETVYG